MCSFPKLEGPAVSTGRVVLALSALELTEDPSKGTGGLGAGEDQLSHLTHGRLLRAHRF